MKGQISPNYDYAYGSRYGFLLEEAAHVAQATCRAAWLCDVYVPEGGELFWSEYSNLRQVGWAFKLRGATVFATRHSDAQLTSMSIFGPDEGAVTSVYLALRAYWPEIRQEQGLLPVTFWALRPNGPSQYVRHIETPSWQSIAPNYPPSGLDVLMNMQGHDLGGGKVIIWHGIPGTGKTWALRALGESWRKWCQFHYIIDPERFFGEAPAYLVDVLLDEGTEDLWRLIIIEDAGELLSADAKERSGQGVSRLLNVTDGLIGQGIKIMFLITTNEDSDRLHAAVKRQGRCLSEVNFKPFEAPEAREWLLRGGYDGDMPGSRTTLADLYGIAQGAIKPDQQRRVGF